MIKFEIDKPLEVTNTPKNQYELIIFYNHGDSDAETEENFLYEINQEDELRVAVQVAMALVEMDISPKYFDRRTRKVKVKEKLPHIDQGIIDNLVDDFMTHDITHFDVDALVADFAVNYYNNDGIGYRVNVKKE